ncbi:hypothetical protein LPJ54_006069, partial [Coemansia sp. RSA 1824]
MNSSSTPTPSSLQPRGLKTTLRNKLKRSFSRCSSVTLDTPPSQTTPSNSKPNYEAR